MMGFLSVARTCCFQMRNFASSTTKKIKKSVFISQSKDVYTNLALESWISKNFDLSNHHILMVCQNDPCVVLGRDQNPWIETNTLDMNRRYQKNVKIARRSSEGGTTFHDNGNLNITFFTPKGYDSHSYNVDVISRALFRNYETKVDVRNNNLAIRNRKISDVSSKIGNKNTYHSYTLLVNTNKVDLQMALSKNEIGIRTAATKSSPKSIMNLTDENGKITTQNLLKALGWEYLQAPTPFVSDEGENVSIKQKGFQLINPTNDWLPGLHDIRKKYTSWDWIFGKTPVFNQVYTFSAGTPDFFEINILVEGGFIIDAAYSFPSYVWDHIDEETVNVFLKGKPYTEEILKNLEYSVSNMLHEKEKYIREGRC